MFMGVIIVVNCIIICIEIFFRKDIFGINMLILDVDLNGFCRIMNKDEINNGNSILIL